MTKAFWVYIFYFRRCWIAPLVQRGGRKGVTLIQVASHFLSRRSMQIDTGVRLAHQRVRDTCLYCFYHPCSNTWSPRTATISGIFPLVSLASWQRPKLRWKGTKGDISKLCHVLDVGCLESGDVTGQHVLCGELLRKLVSFPFLWLAACIRC